MHRNLFIAVAFVCFVVADGHAAQVLLRGECRPTSSVVRLADVAEITDANPEQAANLGALELLPAPAAPRRLRVRELQDQLELRGIDLSKLHFSGAASVLIQPASGPVKASKISTVAYRVAGKSLEEAILRHLQETVDDSEPWAVEVQASDDAVRLTSGATGTLRIAGGSAPWTGTQTFQVIGIVNGAVTQTNVTAKVSLPPQVVIALHNIPRGTSSSPLTLRRSGPQAGSSTPTQCNRWTRWWDARRPGRSPKDRPWNAVSSVRRCW